MSPTSKRSATAEDGFTLVEVLVALTLFAVVALASLSFVTGSLAATARARTDTVAKNLNQQRLELMRNLPYSISAGITNGSPDLLDTYYVSTYTAATSTASPGFVSAASTLRDVPNGDPATGPFYRAVFPAASSYPGYTQRTTAQFLDNNGVAIPAPAFSSTSTGLDGRPPASTVAVTVTTNWTFRGKVKHLTTYSQVTDGLATPPSVTLQNRLNVLRFSGTLANGQEVQVSAGNLSLDGSLANSLSATASVEGVFASVANGSRLDGALAAMAAPPTGTLASTNGSSLVLQDSGVTVAAAGTSGTSSFAVSTANGQPGVGTSATPATATLYGGGMGNDAMTLANQADFSSRLSLVQGPQVTLYAPTCGGSCAAVQGSGYLASTPAPGHTATASAAGSITGTIRILPTTFAPNGLLQVTLSSLSASCVSQPGMSPNGKATMSYSASLSYWRLDPSTGQYGYTTPISLSSSLASDPLAAVALATTQVGVDSSGVPLYLGDYVQSWSSLTSTAIAKLGEVNATGSSTDLSIPGAFTFTSRNIGGNEGQTIGVQVGALSCVATDTR